ncbi:hypothetical protein GCM10009718_11200 [Isoptericola halotolerans]|uniref:Lipoprotein n=1 Tax=Isoptericola halotolerans TaxID=300560 RepID=A0ABX1ZZH0_9MICO|nr:hypothetical protein [Isoptericola halotolerans]NOV95959.1 hypothetical protein [Isoptericola halotolerans]
MLSLRLRTRRAVAALVVTLAVGTTLGACSSSEGPSSAAPEPAPAVSVDSGLAMSNEGDPAPSSTLSEECAELQEAWAATNRALAGIDEEHPRLLVAGFREAYRSITSVEDTEDVPGWDGMTTYLDKAVGAFEDIDTDDAQAVASAVTLALSDVDTARATTAHGSVTEYLDAGCRR